MHETIREMWKFTPWTDHSSKYGTLLHLITLWFYCNCFIRTQHATTSFLQRIRVLGKKAIVIACSFFYVLLKLSPELSTVYVRKKILETLSSTEKLTKVCCLKGMTGKRLGNFEKKKLKKSEKDWKRLRNIQKNAKYSKKSAKYNKRLESIKTTGSLITWFAESEDQWHQIIFVEEIAKYWIISDLSVFFYFLLVDLLHVFILAME